MAIAFNGFAYAQARYTFVLMPVAALLVAVEWDRLTRKKEFSFIGLGLGLISSLYIVIKAYNKASLEVRSYDAEIIILQICFAFLLLVMFFWKNKQGRKIVESLLIVCVLLSTCTETYMTTSQRGTAYTTTEEIGYDGHTMTMIR